VPGVGIFLKIETPNSTSHSYSEVWLSKEADYHSSFHSLVALLGVMSVDGRKHTVVVIFLD